MELKDAHGRSLNYVRLAVTDRCNLRCSYCMPECGIDFVDRADLLTYEEMTRVLGALATVGVNKLRLTGGEPFVRKGVMDFIQKLHDAKWFEIINLTTNATLIGPYVDRFREVGIKTVNISLDTLNRERFNFITKRDELSDVVYNMNALLAQGIDVKINMVVMSGVNEDDIVSMARLAANPQISVRFLEEMPFNGQSNVKKKYFTHIDIKSSLERELGPLEALPMVPSETSANYKVSGLAGTIGIIASYSRTFCGTCNRLRITPTGIVKTCLYDDGSLDLRNYLRNGATDKQMLSAIQVAVQHKAKDGFEAENRRGNPFIDESMASIGG